MAENTTTRVVEVQVDNAEAIKLIADYNAKIEESTAKEKALREEIKRKGEASAADREELAKLRAEQTAYKRELREVEKEVQNNIKAAREAEGSNRKLRAELSNLTKQYDSMSAAMQKSAEGQALKKQINEITDGRGHAKILPECRQLSRPQTARNAVGRNSSATRADEIRGQRNDAGVSRPAGRCRKHERCPCRRRSGHQCRGIRHGTTRRAHKGDAESFAAMGAMVYTFKAVRGRK
jgi:chromosome segregation ATPase